MSISKISYTDKTAGDFYTAADANDVKTVVNANADELLNISTTDMAFYGADPSATGEVNRIAMQQALDQKGIVVLSQAGTYDLDATLLIPSDTTWIIAPGVSLRKTGSVSTHAQVFVNEAAASTDPSVRDNNIRVIGNGVNLIANGRDSLSGVTQWGLRAQVNFYKLTDFEVTGLSMFDNGTGLYTYHFIDCHNGEINDMWAEGEKDGLNISVCTNVTIDRLDTKCKDDGMFIGGYAFTNALPIFGQTENITIRNYTDHAHPGQLGYSVRLYPASWAEWANGNTYILGDVVVSDGKIYQKMNGPLQEDTASDPPTHTSGVVTGSDGIEWRFKQVGTFTEANVRDIKFEGYTSNANRPFLKCDNIVNTFARNTYPGTFGNAEASDIIFDNIKWEPDTANSGSQMLLFENNLTSIKLMNTDIEIFGSNALVIFSGLVDVPNALCRFVIQDSKIKLGADADFILTGSNATQTAEFISIENSEIICGNPSIGSFINTRENATLANLELRNTFIYNLPSLIYAGENMSVNIRVFGGGFINPDWIIYSPSAGYGIEYSSYGTYYDDPTNVLFRTSATGGIVASGYGSRGDVAFSKLYQGDGVDLLNFDLPEGAINYRATITAPGTTAAQTINKIVGRVNIEAGASSKVVTNSIVAADSIVLATCATNDTTAIVKNVIATAGSFTINLDSNTTAETAINFFVLN